MKHPRTHLVRFLRGFSLLELLVAMAILSMLMTMMFSLLGGTISLWELGNKRIEAAQTARVGLNIIANDLRRAISDQQISYTTTGNATTNTIPFVATSTTLYGVLATGKTNQPFEEFGYTCTKNTDTNSVMMTNRYYLVRSYSGTNSGSDFYFRDTVSAAFAGNPGSQFPIIENCVKLEFSYANTNSGNVVFENTWTSQTNLPAGILVSVWVLDSRTAEKFSDQTPDNLTNRAVRMRRFIPLNMH
ncbi:MAG: prepilin-type N-terminal cleavage/methylation domain-containing protein [Verrucomicrobia bacterium]|nr:prepilin-type N-terminal cleavage/methylation domain-containing protein [Verrucomicrobiota bacterium]